MHTDTEQKYINMTILKLNQIKSGPGARKGRKRVGLGRGSGTGKTAGRGHKGQKSRSGGFHKVGFEGGQMPLQRRLPKRGFRSRASLHHAEVRLGELNKIDGDVVDLESLKKAKVIRHHITSAKVILSGQIGRSVTVVDVSLSKGAEAAIVNAGGKVEQPRAE